MRLRVFNERHCASRIRERNVQLFTAWVKVRALQQKKLRGRATFLAIVTTLKEETGVWTKI